MQNESDRQIDRERESKNYPNDIIGSKITRTKLSPLVEVTLLNEGDRRVFCGLVSVSASAALPPLHST